MPHQYYIQDFKQTSNIYLSDGYSMQHKGTVKCPSVPDIHGKEIIVHTRRISHQHTQQFIIDGIEQVFTSGDQIQAVFDLELVDPESVDWGL